MLILARVVHPPDNWLSDRTFMTRSAEGSKALHQTVITLTGSFPVFTFGSLLVAIQVASGQMTPRVITTTLLRNHTVRHTVRLFVVALLFAQHGLARTASEAHQLSALITGLLGFASLAAFLFFIDYAARSLRPGRIVAKIADAGIAVTRDAYPLADAMQAVAAEEVARRGSASRNLCPQGTSAVVLAANMTEVLALARTADTQGLGASATTRPS